MKQHIISVHSIKTLKAVLALSVLFSFQPTFAQDPTPANPIKTSKSVKYNYETGEGVITLESYVKGEIEKKPFLNPTDLVLVLDVSNSMCPYNSGTNKNETVGSRVFLFNGDKIDYLHKGTSETDNNTTTHNYKTVQDGKLRYTLKLGGTGTEYNLAYFNNTGGKNGWYYSTGTNTGGGTWMKYTPNAADEIYTDVKLDLLENACRSLIDVIYDNPPKTGTSHRISVITWADNNTGTSSIHYVNLGLTAATTANYNTLIENVTFLETGPNTWPTRGLNKAITNLNSSSSDRDKLVLFFTDGEPNESFNSILSAAKTLKDGGAKIFSVALVANDQATANTWNHDSNISIQTYLEIVSSLYPGATSTSNKGTKNTDGLPYYQHSTGADLSAAFKEIGMAIDGGADVESLNASDGVKLTDKINNNFCVLGDVSLIKTYVAACTGKDGTELTFGNKVEVTDRDSLSVTVAAAATPQSIDVKGFNYSDNWCGYDAKAEGYHGQKIIVEIPFKMKAPGSTALTSITTNADGSSLYKNTSAIDGAAFTSPTIPFTEITIEKTGLKAGESAIYIVKKGDVEITRIILTGTSDAGTMVSTKLRLLDPNGDYSVTEAGWDYNYTLTSSNRTDNVFKFFSSKKSGTDKSDEAQKVNLFK